MKFSELEFDKIIKRVEKLKKLDEDTCIDLVYQFMDRLYFSLSNFGRIVGIPHQIYIPKTDNIYVAIPEEWVKNAVNGEKPLRVSVNPVRDPRLVFAEEKSKVVEEFRKKQYPSTILKTLEIAKVGIDKLIPYIERIHLDLDLHEYNLREKIKIVLQLGNYIRSLFNIEPLIYITGRGVVIQVFLRDKPRVTQYRKILGGFLDMLFTELPIVGEKFLTTIDESFKDIDSGAVATSPLVHCRIPFTRNENNKEIVILVQNNDVVVESNQVIIDSIDSKYISHVDVYEVVKKIRNVFRIGTKPVNKEKEEETVLKGVKIIKLHRLSEKKKIIEFREKIVKKGVPDCLKRLIIHVVIPTLIHVDEVGKTVIIPEELKGISILSAPSRFPIEVVNAFNIIKSKCLEFIKNSMINYGHEMINESWLDAQIKYQLSSKPRGSWIWRNCEDVEKQDPQCFEVLKEVGICRET